MTPQELGKLLRKTEGLKLDFKREYKLQAKAPDGVDGKWWHQFVIGQWHELIKDILALTNGNFGTAKEYAFLIIGVDDQLMSDGSRKLYDASYLEVTGQQILSKVNAACYPPLPQLNCEFVQLDGYKICVISIPPSPFVHETTKQLETTKGEFDSNGKLRHVKPGKTYTIHTAFVRRGEDIFPATNVERRKLEEEKGTLIRPVGVPRQTSQNGRNTATNNNKPPQPSAKTSKLSVTDQVREKLRVDVLEPLKKKYIVFKLGILIQIAWITLLILLVMSALGDFPSEMIIFLLVPSLVLLMYFSSLYFILKGSASESGFYGKLRLVSQRDDVRAEIKAMDTIEQGFLDKYLYKGYITLFLHLLLPSKRGR